MQTIIVLKFLKPFTSTEYEPQEGPNFWLSEADFLKMRAPRCIYHILLLHILLYRSNRIDLLDLYKPRRWDIAL